MNSDFLHFSSLIDSGSSDCFIDSSFISSHSIPTYPIPPVQLRLLDGSLASTISSMATLPIVFPSRETISLDFYVTTLDSSCEAVLGYNFLDRYNPLIDWNKKVLTFRTSEQVASSQASSADPIPTVETPTAKSSKTLPKRSPSKFPFEPIYTYPTITQMAGRVTDTDKPDIRIIGAAAFIRVCKDSGIQPMALFPSDYPKVSGKSATTESPPIPPEYADFADVFDEELSYKLPKHRPYDLKIDLEEGAEPPLGRIYPLSLKEQEALREFIDKNLSAGFLRSSSSAHGAPVLFVPKKNGGLRLCVDFRGLNKITKKDWDPFPLISDLLETPSHTKIYTKVDL